MQTKKSLTKRQLEIWRAIASGQTNQQIACALGLSANTVKRHITALYQRLRLRNRTQAAMAYVITERLP